VRPTRWRGCRAAVVARNSGCDAAAAAAIGKQLDSPDITSVVIIGGCHNVAIATSLDDSTDFEWHVHGPVVIAQANAEMDASDAPWERFAVDTMKVARTVPNDPVR
jgi:hypothetical protein